jgi:hypothetical protein
MLLNNVSAFAVIVLWAGATFAQQATVGGADLFAPSLQAGEKIDAERALPITPFYEPATVKTTAKAGTLVRAEPATDYALPPGTTAIRILYHTRTAADKDALATGVVLVPYGRPSQGWLAFAGLVPWHKRRREQLCPLSYEIFVL